MQEEAIFFGKMRHRKRCCPCPSPPVRGQR